MKRHLQTQGTRKWYGEHLVELQDETLKAIDAMASTLGACVISGCEIYSIEGDNFRMTDGLVALPCADGKIRIMPYIDNAVISGYFAIKYLVSSQSDVLGEYLNPISTVIAKNWKAVWSNTEPSHGGLMKPSGESLKKFSDLIKDEMDNYYEPIFNKNAAFNKDFGQGSSEVEVGSNNPNGLKTRRIDIGEWNMVNDASVTIDLSSYGITTLLNLEVLIIVRKAEVVPIQFYSFSLQTGGYWRYNSNREELELYRNSDSIFLTYDELGANVNKGYIILTYI